MASNSFTEPEADISAWETGEGLPQPTDQFVQRYLEGREALIEQEKTQRSDYAFRQSLNPLAVEACAILSRIRAEELRTIWTNDHQEPSPSREGVNYYPGMMFTLAKERMETTKSWQIIKKMPKGALLHAHFDAMIDLDWLIEQVLSTDGMAIQADKGLVTVESRASGHVSFRYKKITPTHPNSIWDEEYDPNKMVPLKLAAANFPEGGLQGFKAWLKGRCTITLEESLDHHHGLDAVWEKFKSCFPILNSMIGYEPILRASIQHLLRDLADDGLRWVDLRLAFIFDYYREGSEEPEEGYQEFFRVFGEEVEKFQRTVEGAKFWGCRFIWTTLRSFGKRQMVESMKECILIKQKYPELVSGFDVVGQEDLGRTLVDLTPEFFWFRKRCVESNVDIPFFFHAGECLGDGDDTDQNLFDAILLGTRRIGHGFSLYKHPLLIEMVKQKKILIESCPISNEVLRLTSSIRSHPLPALLSRGVAVALCNDDPAILGQGTNGTSHDFWQAFQGWESLGLEGLGSLAENSVRYAAFSPDQTTKEWNKDIKDGVFGDGIRAARLREFHAEWNKFCEWIVMEHAGDYGSDDE